MMDASEIKRTVAIETVVTYYGGRGNGKSREPCLLPRNHNNGDAHPSMTIKDGRVKCWSQGCFGQHGADIFELVGIIEGIDSFSDQLKRVCEIAGIAGRDNGQRRIIRRYQWVDTEGREAWHLRWEPGDPKFTWAQDPDGKRPGRGRCAPTLYNLGAIHAASTVIVCPGEHDQQTVNDWLQELQRYGVTVATTTPNGEADVKVEYLKDLSGKCVVLSGQNDERGRQYPRLCRQALPSAVRDVLRLMAPPGHKDWAEWKDADMTAQDFAKLLDQAEPYPHEEVKPTTDAGPWSKAQAAKDFLNAAEKDVPMLEPRLVAKGSITELFSPRGIGKTHAAHSLAVKLARLGQRVLLLDRDNSRREVTRRLRAWGATGLTTLKVLTRDDVPPLTDAAKWREFPFQDYDLVVIDSLDSSTEGCGEQDSAKPSRAIAPLLDIAHRDNGPAILVLGNTVKSGAHSRGSGVVEDRADVAYEVRDATDLKPSGTKDWWLELPPSGAKEWASRASRRKRRDSYRLAFIASKYRIGEEPDPFVFEISMPSNGEPWTMREATADILQEGEDAKKAADTEHERTLDRAAIDLADQIRQRVEARPMLSETDAVPFLQENHNLTRQDARDLIKARTGTLWHRIPGEGQGHPLILVPNGYKTNPAAKMPSEGQPQRTRHPGDHISADRLEKGRRKSETKEAASNTDETVEGFSPPDEGIQEEIVIEDAT